MRSINCSYHATRNWVSCSCIEAVGGDDDLVTESSLVGDELLIVVPL